MTNSPGFDPSHATFVNSASLFHDWKSVVSKYKKYRSTAHSRAKKKEGGGKGSKKGGGENGKATAKAKAKGKAKAKSKARGKEDASKDKSTEAASDGGGGPRIKNPNVLANILALVDAKECEANKSTIKHMAERIGDMLGEDLATESRTVVAYLHALTTPSAQLTLEPWQGIVAISLAMATSRLDTADRSDTDDDDDGNVRPAATAASKSKAKKEEKESKASSAKASKSKPKPALGRGKPGVSAVASELSNDDDDDDAKAAASSRNRRPSETKGPPAQLFNDSGSETEVKRDLPSKASPPRSSLSSSVPARPATPPPPPSPPVLSKPIPTAAAATEEDEDLESVVAAELRAMGMMAPVPSPMPVETAAPLDDPLNDIF